ncbi:hypothetical protein, partial [Rhizobium laguerreae]|uniref:hypothetical protein n=1 Tax=Rhizobium laguerreae TaxID=1076926 RepID=UPI00197E237B
SMLASTPASILNHKTPKIGIPSDSTKSGYALAGMPMGMPALRPPLNNAKPQTGRRGQYRGQMAA